MALLKIIKIKLSFLNTHKLALELIHARIMLIFSGFFVPFSFLVIIPVNPEPAVIIPAIAKPYLVGMVKCNYIAGGT